MESIPKTKFVTVDEYLSILPQKVRDSLEELRKTVNQVEPDAEELISYNMPAFRFHGILVYYAAHKSHIGFYPGNSIVNEVFKNDLGKYETSKGTIKFPIEKPLPLRLIKRIVKYRVKQNLDKRAVNVKKKK
jgi:uncharacterized protein YdhG (YjbR/CyaY superfamily)